MTITFDAIPSNIVASKVAIEIKSFVSALSNALIPQKILLFGQYDNAKTITDYVPFEITGGVQEIKNKYGYGSMLALMGEKAFQAAGTTIPVFVAPIPDDGAGIVATGSIQVTAAATSDGVLTFYIAGQKISALVTSGDTVNDIATAIDAAIDALADLPVTAIPTTDTVDLTAKWKGITGNFISIKQNLGGTAEETASPAGVTIVITDMASGAVNPDVTDVFQYMGGSDWFTVPVNPFADTANLTVIEAESELLADPLVKRIPNFITGTVEDYTTALALADSRDARFNTFMPAHNSVSLPFEVGASFAGRVANSAQLDPSRPFKTLSLPGIWPGDQLTYAQIDAAEKKGLSATTVNAAGQVVVYDAVTTYKTAPGGAPDTSYRYTSTISNIQAKVFSLDVVFNSEPFTRAKIVDDNAITSQQYAVSPKVVKSFTIDLIDKIWIAQAWSKNRDDIVESIQAEINETNASRIDLALIDQIVLGDRILAVQYGFAFAPVS